MYDKNMVSWLPEIESNIDHRVVNYLSKYHREYQDLRKAAKKIQQKYSELLYSMESERGEIKLSAEEHQNFIEYQQIKSDYEGIERQYFYLLGQADLIRYYHLLERLSQEPSEKDD